MDAQHFTEQKVNEALKQLSSLSSDIFTLEGLIVKLQMQFAVLSTQMAALRALRLERIANALEALASSPQREKEQ